jgi:hypothetical protein
MPAPAKPKVYHIVHGDQLPSIAADGFIWSDEEVFKRQCAGTTIGMSRIKERRLKQLTLSCHPGLYVGSCAPFYFCPRSVMLFLIHRRNEELAYKGGQEPIVHLEADLYGAIAWAQKNNRRWAFTLSNAGAYYFESRCDLAQLDEISWDAVATKQWAGPLKEGKQAEFLVEQCFPWSLIERIGVHSQGIATRVSIAMQGMAHRPGVEVRRDWYY